MDHSKENAKAVQCPCNKYTDKDELYSALTSTKRTKEVIEWLSGEIKSSSCQSSRCVHRVNTSLAILNDIRHACRGFLEKTELSQNDDKRQPSLNTSVGYELSFPSLSASIQNNNSAPNVLVARKKQIQTSEGAAANRLQTLSKPKRRIRPAQAWTSTGNISSLPSSSPLLPKRPPTSAEKLSENAVNLSVMGNSSNDFTLKRVWGKPVQHPGTTVGPPTREITASKEPLVLSDIHCNPLDGRHSQADTDNVVSLNRHPIGDSKGEKITVLQSKQPLNVRKPDNAVNHAKGVVHRSPSVGTGSQTISLPSSSTEGKEWSSSMPQTKVTEITTIPAWSVGSDSDKIEKLAQIYTTLILSALVPSTPLELHLLINLLTLKDITKQTDNNHALSNVFVSAAACRAFAARSFTKLESIIGNLHLDLLAAFVDCPTIRDTLPNLWDNLSTQFNVRRNASVETDTGFNGGTQPILALPFDQTRDSRHNYKTREESALYKNREESRDAFIYQLRHFQNVRGRVLDMAELESSLKKIRQSSRDVIQGIHRPNMHWFAQLFSDLLLQIGLVPMEETDRELLSIANKDKLQKLHKRFSSKVGTLKGSSTKVLSDIDDRHSPEKEAHQFFPGHQEFFFIFLHSVDSYSFGVHLKSRLASVILSLASHIEVKGLQDRLMKLSLLSKFLGVVSFSQNWHRSGVSDVLSSVSNDETMIWTNTSEVNLPLLDLLDSAYQKRHLLCTVPWILELLRMAKWDSLFMGSQCMASICSKLVFVHNSIRNEPSPNLQLVSFCLESFFYQVVGLRRTHSLPVTENMYAQANWENTTDYLQLTFSKTFLFSSISHLDELLGILSSITLGKTKASGTPRKMRPSIIAGPMSSFSSFSFPEDPMPSMSNQKTDATQESSHSTIVDKLVDMFFHQHRELKEICEFVVDRATQKVLTSLQQSVLPDHFKKISYDKAETDFPVDLQEVKDEALRQSLAFTADSLHTTICTSVYCLSPLSKASKVLDIAVHLATKHAIKSVEDKVFSLVNSEMERNWEGFLRSEKKRQGTKGLSSEDDVHRE